MTLRGQILVSRTDDDTTLPSVCPFKTSPVYDGTTRTCWKACARVAGIHGDVLNVQTEVFSVPHHTAHTAQHTPTHNITQNHTQHHTEKMGKRERQKKEKKEKERERERERKRRKREKERENERERNRERDRETERQRDREKTEEERQDKRRDQESRQDEKEERWNYEFFQQMFQDPQTRQMNEPNMFRKKKKKQNFSDELFLHFFFESSESDRFFNYLHDSNWIFRVRGINSENVPGCTVRRTAFGRKKSRRSTMPEYWEDFVSETLKNAWRTLESHMESNAPWKLQNSFKDVEGISTGATTRWTKAGSNSMPRQIA